MPATPSRNSCVRRCSLRQIVAREGPEVVAGAFGLRRDGIEHKAVDASASGRPVGRRAGTAPLAAWRRRRRWRWCTGASKRMICQRSTLPGVAAGCGCRPRTAAARCSPSSASPSRCGRHGWRRTAPRRPRGGRCCRRARTSRASGPSGCRPPDGSRTCTWISLAVAGPRRVVVPMQVGHPRRVGQVGSPGHTQTKRCFSTTG